MERTEVTLTHPEKDETYTVSADVIIECEHCGHTWGSTAQSRRPTCPSCQRKTDRENHGYHYSLITRYMMNGENEPIEFSTAHEALNYIHDLLEAFEHEGWSIDSHGGQGSFFLSSPEAPPNGTVE